MKHIRQPKQQRSIQTKEQIKKAAFQLFSRKGIHGTNSREIVEKAGVSIGSFYAYFKNKKNLLLEILEDHCDRVFTAIWQPLNGFDLQDMSIAEIRKMIESVFEAYQIAPEFHRQTHTLRYSDPEINRIFGRERNREIAQIQLILKKTTTRQEPGDLYTAAVIIHNLVESVIHTYVYLGPEVEKEQLLKQVSLAIRSYVTALEE